MRPYMNNVRLLGAKIPEPYSEGSRPRWSQGLFEPRRSWFELPSSAIHPACKLPFFFFLVRQTTSSCLVSLLCLSFSKSNTETIAYVRKQYEDVRKQPLCDVCCRLVEKYFYYNHVLRALHKGALKSENLGRLKRRKIPIYYSRRHPLFNNVRNAESLKTGVAAPYIFPLYNF